MTDLSIVVPFLNEEESVPRLGAELSSLVASLPGLSVEIVLVNDGSTDGSVERIRRTPFPPGTRLLSLSQNYGSHAALRAGIAEAAGERIAFLYADLQDPPELVRRLHDRSVAGFDIVWASREATQAGTVEGLVSRRYAALMKRFVNPRFPEQGFDVVMFNRRVRDQLLANVEANSSIFLQILNLGFRQDFIGYEKRARTAGVSKWTLSRKIKLLIDSFVAFSYAPIRLVTLLGFAFFFVGAGWTVYITARKLLFDDLASGWPMLTSILLLGFGLTNISLGIIAEYVWRTLDATRRRPVYIVDSVETLGAPRSPQSPS